MQAEHTTSLLKLFEKITGQLNGQEALLMFLAVALVTCLLLLVRSSGRNRDLARKLKNAAARIHRYEEENAGLKNAETDYKVREARLTTIIRTERRNSEEKLALLEEARDELRHQFASLAREIFDERNESFTSQSKEKLESLLSPFHLQLDELKKEIRHTYLNDTRERTSLKSELSHLRELNLQMSREAVNLTRALKGDKKIQGNWGEMVLESILDKSGLRKGFEYETQKGFRDRENKLFKPDVVLHLPDERDIIIDSKVSLVAWEKYCTSEQESDKRKYISELTEAIRTHVTTLSSKNYEELTGTRSLDFVLMFMPIEGAFLAAFANDHRLFEDCFGKRIAIVTPTTLLATLKTIENMWRYEQQSRNSLEIARKAGTLYDKLCGFVEDLEKIGRLLRSSSDSYDSAMNKLANGRGNLISQANQLIDLGVQVKKELPRSAAPEEDNTRNS